MNEEFSADFFAGNRARLRELFTGTAPIVITANGLLQRSGDSAFPFQQDANFWYLTGINEPDVILVMDKDKEYLIVPEISDYQNIFDRGIDIDAFSRGSGIATVLPTKVGWKQLTTRLKKVKHVATLAANPAYMETYGMYVNPAREALILKIKEINPDVDLLDLRQHLAKQRLVKQPAELAVMRRAIDLTILAFKKVRPKIAKLNYEYEIEAEISGHFLRNGGIDAWKPIVASGANSCIMHARGNHSELVKNELVLIDIGVELNHYCSDLTRTFSIGGKSTRRQQAVYAAVKEAQDFAIDQLKPGIAFWDCEQNVRAFVGEKLRELGLIKTIDKEAVAQFYPHAPHYLGIDVHDVGDYHVPLEPGMVVTVEPGIYIPEENIGVRIEDDILITADGHENLSARLAREL